MPFLLDFAMAIPRAELGSTTCPVSFSSPNEPLAGTSKSEGDPALGVSSSASSKSEGDPSLGELRAELGKDGGDSTLLSSLIVEALVSASEGAWELLSSLSEIESLGQVSVNAQLIGTRRSQFVQSLVDTMPCSHPIMTELVEAADQFSLDVADLVDRST